MKYVGMNFQRGFIPIRIILILVAVVTIGGALYYSTKSYTLTRSHVQIQIVKEKYQIKYLPKETQNIYLGMAFSEFEKIRPAARRKNSPYFDFRFEFEEIIHSKEVESIIYYFDSEDNKRLYELIVILKVDPIKYGVAQYGQPNFGSVWRYDSQEGFLIKIWTFENKIIIAGMIQGTEYEGEEDKLPDVDEWKKLR